MASYNGPSPRNGRMLNTSLKTWQQAEQWRQAGRSDLAHPAYESLLADPDWILPAELRLSALEMGRGRVRKACAHSLAAYGVRESDAILMEALAQQLLNAGELELAVACATSPAVMQTDTVEVLVGVGKLLSDQSFPALALPLLLRARELGANDTSLHYLIGLCQMYSGHIEDAAQHFGTCLRMDPDFAAAHRLRAKLRKQTIADNHVDAIRASVERTGEHHPDAPSLQYALFKELDDLRSHEAAWQALECGMRARRRQVRYDADGESRLFDHLLASTHGREPSTEAHAGPTPIFIVGMPRSGTTLLERILGAHPDVSDAGELRDFTTQMRWMCDLAGGPHLDLELAQAAQGIDWNELGQRYLSHTQWHAAGRRFYTDKLPANFINIGYIARALPQARILHMVREPMDTCFSNLKELFADAYPHSYDQREMAAHFLRYRKLMTHWHTQFPGRVLDVHYDELVSDPESVTRQVLSFCGLPWNSNLTAIESREGGVATASTVQMREPIHQRFLGQWRRYTAWLGPLRESLQQGGLDDLGAP